MELLQGSTYSLPIKIKDSSGKIITQSDVKKVVVTIGSINKSSDNGDISFNSSLNSWIVKLTEQETFSLNGTIKWQARFLFKDGTIDGTLPEIGNVYKSINLDRLSGGENDA